MHPRSCGEQVAPLALFVILSRRTRFCCESRHNATRLRRLAAPSGEDDAPSVLFATLFAKHANRSLTAPIRDLGAGTARQRDIPQR